MRLNRRTKDINIMPKNNKNSGNKAIYSFNISDYPIYHEGLMNETNNKSIIKSNNTNTGAGMSFAQAWLLSVWAWG